MTKIVGILLCWAVMMSASACMKDVDLPSTPQVPHTQDPTEVRLSLILPEGIDFNTRALSFTAENTVDNIYVLVFNQNNNLVDIKRAESLTPAPGPDPGYTPGQPYSGAYNYSLTLQANASNTTTRLVVLANSTRILTNTIGMDTSSAYVGRSYSDVIAAIYENISSQMYPATTGRIPMWGETGQIQITSGSSMTVAMMRAVARIDVGVGQPTWNGTDKSYTWNGNNSQGTAIPFRITSVTVVRPNNRYAVVPAQANHTGTTVTAPTVPSGTTAFSLADSKTNFTYNTTTGYVTYSIYTPEADIIMGGSGRPGDANHANRMAIVVGGNYNNSPTTTYYRLDFATGGNLINVLRNNLYMFSISGATGPGYTSVDDAYASQSFNMTANVLQWNQRNLGSIYFDGQHVLAIDKPNVSLFNTQYSTTLPTNENVVQIYTDVAAGWTMDRIVAADGVTPVSWLTAAPTSGAVNTTARMVLGATQNTTGAARSAIIWLTADRLRVPVYVTQNIQQAVALNIVNSSNQDIEELIFPNPVADQQPASQILRVNWSPATSSVIVAASQVGGSSAPFPDPGAGYNDGAPYNSMPWSWNTGTHDFTIQPPALTAAEIAANPLINKRSRYFMILSSSGNSFIKQVILTQLRYGLLVEPNPFPQPYFPMDGNRASYNVRSNTTWRISNIVETPRVAGTRLIAPPTGPDNVYVGATGGSYTPSGGVTNELLTTNNAARGMSGWADVTYESDQTPAQFSPVTRRLFFPAANFNVYGITGMNNTGASIYNIYAGNTNTRNMQAMITNPAAFGTNVSGVNGTPTSTVFVRSINMNGYNNDASTVINSSHITAATNAGADMLVISGNTTYDQQTAVDIYTQFLARDKPVLLCLEDPNPLSYIFTVLRAAGRLSSYNDNMYWPTTTINGLAPVYWYYSFVDTTEPIIYGQFGGLNGRYWGVDGTGSMAFWFTDSTGAHSTANIFPYSNANNQSGANGPIPSGLPAGASMDNGYTMFRFRNVPLIVVCDGGFMATYDTASTTASPSVLDTNNLPAGKSNYGGGSTKRTIYNSPFIANVIAWAIQRRTTQ